jgi:hypothetical protein
MAVTSCEPAVRALEGVKYRREDAEKVLSGLDIRAMFGGITADEILKVMFGECEDVC